MRWLISVMSLGEFSLHPWDLETFPAPSGTPDRSVMRDGAATAPPCWKTWIQHVYRSHKRIIRPICKSTSTLQLHLHSYKLNFDHTEIHVLFSINYASDLWEEYAAVWVRVKPSSRQRRAHSTSLRLSLSIGIKALVQTEQTNNLWRLCCFAVLWTVGSAMLSSLPLDLMHSHGLWEICLLQIVFKVIYHVLSKYLALNKTVTCAGLN